MECRIATLPGDGVGPEVVDQAVGVLDAVATRFGHTFQFSNYAIGGSAVDSQGNPLPDETRNGCKDCDAILLGAVGGSEWGNLEVEKRPEAGLLRLRKEQISSVRKRWAHWL